ncbi:MAG: periplasmic copper chaperone [Sphingomonadales bacterium]|jgi:copper(I)-binding protein|nr:periplasmic copper chaperone [Sphingomonadales bacterium]
MKRLVPIMAASFLLACCAAPPEPAGPTVENAWIRLPALYGNPGAAYFTIRGGGEPVRLTGISTYAAPRVELHESRMEGTMAHMAPLREVAIGPHERIAFEPGGRHAMLFDITQETTISRQPTLVFRFANGGRVTVNAFVLAANDPPPRFVPPPTDGSPCVPRATRSAYEVTITNCGR